MSSAKQNPCGSVDFEIICVNKDVNRDGGECMCVCVCLFALIKTAVTAGKSQKFFTFAGLRPQADGRSFFLSEKFRSSSSLNKPLFGVHKLATVYSS